MLNGQPLCIDGFCGLGGWAEGFLAEGWCVVGFDIERHRYPRRAIALDEDGSKSMAGKDRHGNTLMNRALEQVHGFHKAALTGEWDEYPGQLVLQDILTIHGSQFRHADCLVFSPPCMEYSYMAMPWKRAKQIARALRGDGDFPEGYAGSRTIEQLTALFRACFRIQREACEAAGGHIPMVVENVKGAQPWVGRAQANYGSFFLWGDVANVGGRIVVPGARFGEPHVRACRVQKQPGRNFHFPEKYGIPSPSFHGAEHETSVVRAAAIKTGQPGGSFQSAAVVQGVKQTGMSGPAWFDHGAAAHGSKSSARKAASAQIAKIPFELARWVASVYKPKDAAA